MAFRSTEETEEWLGDLSYMIHADNVVFVGNTEFDPSSADWLAAHRPCRWPTTFAWPEDVLRTRSPDGPCIVCGDAHQPPATCFCSTEDWRMAKYSELAVDFRHFPNKGRGVIASRVWDEGDILGDYVGQVVPYRAIANDDYSLVVLQNTEGSTPVALITAREKGNWTRYLNHSCEANLKIVGKRVGSNRLYCVTALRPIFEGEELTLDYGHRFAATGRYCFCGTSSCRYSVDARMQAQTSFVRSRYSFA